MKNRKKRKFKKRYWLLTGLAAVLASPVLLLLYRPSRFNPPHLVYDEQVSPYLTHELLPHIYNNAQLGEPFDLIVIQNKTKDILALTQWPKHFDGFTFSAPQVLFVPDSIVLMGKMAARSAQFVVTVVAEPTLDQNGLVNLRLAKVKVGAVNITPFARVIAKKIYKQHSTTTNSDAENWQTQIAASLLNDQPFDPAFEIEGKKVRPDKISITQGKLTIRLAPASD